MTRNHARIASAQRTGSFRRRLSNVLFGSVGTGVSVAPAMPADAAVQESTTELAAKHVGSSACDEIGPVIRHVTKVLPIASRQRRDLPALPSAVDKTFRDNLMTTGGVIVISILILVAYSYCQVFTWAYVTYATGNDSLQVLMSSVFQVGAHFDCTQHSLVTFIVHSGRCFSSETHSAVSPVVSTSACVELMLSNQLCCC